MKRRRFIAVGSAAISSCVLGGLGSLLQACSTHSQQTLSHFKSQCSLVGQLVLAKFKRAEIVRDVGHHFQKEKPIHPDELRQTIEREYREGKVIYINNWLYSETEAKVAGYRAMRTDCET